MTKYRVKFTDCNGRDRWLKDAYARQGLMESVSLATVFDTHGAALLSAMAIPQRFDYRISIIPVGA